MSKPYDVFARKEYPEPLKYIGSVEADNDDDAVKASLESYGESEWIEMIAVPRDKVTVVFSEEKEISA